MDSKDISYIRDARNNRIKNAKKYISKKLKHGLLHKNDRVLIKYTTLGYWYGLMAKEYDNIIQEYQKTGWNILYYNSNQYNRAVEIILTNSVFENLHPMPSDAELLQNAEREIKELKKQISLLPGGSEYLAAQTRFNKNIAQF
jgi:hypothetical protein